MDSIGASVALKLSGMGIRGAMVFFTFSTLKTVDDHCGYALPFDPLQKLFWNNAAYHDVHHQSWGIKVSPINIMTRFYPVCGTRLVLTKIPQTNYSQPFLICWDRWLGTQWTGGDVSARYKASAERAAELVRREKEGAVVGETATGISTSAAINGNGALPNIANGKAKQQAREGRRQVVATDGVEVLQEETREELAEEPVRRRSTRSRTRKAL